MHATGAEIVRVHPRARRPLVEIHDVFAQFEHPQIRRHCADVHHMAAEVEHMILDTRQLGEKYAEILRADRHVEVEQFLDREHERVLHAHRRAIIEPVEIGDRLEVGLVLDQLFGAAMEQADMRIDAVDDLAIEFHDEAQHAVRGRVLRAKIDREIVDRGIAGRFAARLIANSDDAACGDCFVHNINHKSSPR
jgi:hypothetical protein